MWLSPAGPRTQQAQKSGRSTELARSACGPLAPAGLGRGRGLSRGICGAILGDRALLAQRFAGKAAPAAMEDKVMVEHDPAVLIEEVHKFELDLHRVGCRCPPEPPNDPTHVGVDRDSRIPESST